MKILNAHNASDIYKKLHRAPSLVIALASTAVSVDPSRTPPDRRRTRSLETFVAYKSLYRLVRADTDVEDAFEKFEAWMREVNCDGEGDPRVLPLHIFDAGSEVADLASRSGSRRFREIFGGPAQREDLSGRLWRKGAAHGREGLQVAGCDLATGMHWDVSGSRGALRVASASEVWMIKPRGYLNIYPDESIRGPGRSVRGRVRRVWS